MPCLGPHMQRLARQHTEMCGVWSNMQGETLQVSWTCHKKYVRKQIKTNDCKVSGGLSATRDLTNMEMQNKIQHLGKFLCKMCL